MEDLANLPHKHLRIFCKTHFKYFVSLFKSFAPPNPPPLPSSTYSTSFTNTNAQEKEVKVTNMGAELQSQNHVDVNYGKTFGLGP